MNPSVAVAVLGARSLCIRTCRLSVPTSSYSSKTDTPQQGKKSSGGTSIDPKKLDPPSFVFKKVNTKDVGPGAAKDKEYKNPEYFSYHQMSYADMDIVMSKLRCPQPSSVKK